MGGYTKGKASRKATLSHAVCLHCRVGYNAASVGVTRCSRSYIENVNAEGFGLSTLESMQSGTPIIAAKTGGLTRQVVDHRDGSENGIALDIDFRSLVGSQGVPYIYEDYCSSENTAAAIMKLYRMSDSERKDLSKKVIEYVNDSFSYSEMIDSWDESLHSTIQNWKESYERYSIKTI